MDSLKCSSNTQGGKKRNAGNEPKETKSKQI